MKKHLISGLIILVPILIALMTIKIFLKILAAPFFDMIQFALLTIGADHKLNPEQHLFLTDTLSSILAVIVLVILSLVIGFFANKFFIKFFLNKLEFVFRKIPIIKTIFNISKDLSTQFFNEGDHIFKKTVLTPFPSKGTVAIGFVTAEISGKIKEASGGLDLCVFIPTSPHPVSGFVLLTSQKEVKEIQVSIDEGFRFIMSCGASPLGNPSDTKEC